MPELLDVLSFTTNWNNKLYCDYYTTFRLHNPAKYFVGKQFDVQLKKEHHHNALVVNVKPMYLAEACSSQYLCCMDTGYPPDAFRNIVMTMYKNSAPDIDKALFDLVMLRKIKPEKQK